MFGPSSHAAVPTPADQNPITTGAIKATAGRGLQPAMDHILENEGNPVPDLSSVSSAASSAPPAQPMDEDDQDDLEALSSLGVKGAAAAAAAAAAVTDVEAKACAITSHNQKCRDRLTTAH